MAVKIHGKDYVTVDERVEEFHKRYPNGSIQTELVEFDGKRVITKTTAIPDVEKPEPVVREPEVKEDVKEGYVNYNINPNVVEKFKSKITFDNDQFNELLLYVFTGIFLLIMIDYIFNLGKKAF